MLKKAQVIMLPTNNKSLLHINYSKLQLNKFEQLDVNNQNLYFISNDEIKEGDWFIHHSHGITTLLKAIEINNRIFDNQGTSCSKDYCKKIIATTDTSLKVNSEVNNNNSIKFLLPQPSQQFIEKYIESYNKSDVGSNNYTVTDVLVEYEKCSHKTCNNGCDSQMCRNQHYKLKVNPKDNTITIKKLKDSWNREEYEIGLRKSFNAGMNYAEGGHFGIPDENKWIEQNL
jgi:hypothetical protein